MEILKKFFYLNKNDIIDPLSVVIKLYIYSFKPIGTKISICGNKLEIQELGLFQSTVRTFKGDTKNDLINILFPLTYACEVYLGKYPTHSKFKCIFERIIKSLENLNEVYQINEITHNIEQLKNITMNFLSDFNFNPKTIILNWDEPASVLKKSFYKQTDSIWTKDRIDILFGFINEISNTESEELIGLLIDSLSTYMNYIDVIVVKLINDLHLLR